MGDNSERTEETPNPVDGGGISTTGVASNPGNVPPTWSYREPTREPGMETRSQSGHGGSDTEVSDPLSDNPPPPVGMAAYRAARLGEAGFKRDEPPHDGYTHLGTDSGAALSGRYPPRLPVPVVPVSGELDPRGTKGAESLPDPKDKRARRWDGEGTTLEDMIEWFEARAPASLQGRNRMKAFAKYATPSARSLLEEIPEVLDDINSWEDFLRCLRVNFPDRTRLRNLTTQEFEDRSKRLLAGSWTRREDVFTAGVAFGRLVRQYTRESSDSIRANETYYKLCHQRVADAIIQWYKPRWIAEKGWDGESLPPWKWLLQGHVDWYDPQNKMANAMLLRLRPELPTMAQLAGDASEKKERSMEREEDWGRRWERGVRPREEKPESEADQVERLVKQMHDLSIQHRAGGLKSRKEISVRYQAAHQALRALPGGAAAAACWEPNLKDPLGDGRVFAQACSEALEVAENHGIKSTDYAQKYAIVSYYAPQGRKVSDYLPAPGYMFPDQPAGDLAPRRAVAYSAESTARVGPPPGRSTSSPRGACFFCRGTGHLKANCPVRADYIARGIVRLHPYVAQSGQRMLGDRWALPDHPLHDQRVREEAGKCPKELYEEILGLVGRTSSSPTGPGNTTANLIEVEDNQRLHEDLEAHWYAEDRELSGDEEGVEVCYLELGGSTPAVASVGVQALGLGRWEGTRGVTAGVRGSGSLRKERLRRSDNEVLRSQMERLWDAEDRGLGLPSSGSDPQACQWAEAAPALVDCGVFAVSALGEEYGPRSLSEARGARIMGTTGLLHGQLCDAVGRAEEETLRREATTSFSVSSALRDHVLQAESYAAERSVGDQAARRKAAPYPSSSGGAPSKGYYQPTGATPRREGRPIRGGPPEKPRQGAGTPIVEIPRGGGSKAPSGLPKPASPSPPAAPKGDENGLIPAQMRPKPSILASQVPCETVCAKILEEKMRNLGSLSLRELLAIAPPLAGYLNAVTRRRKVVEASEVLVVEPGPEDHSSDEGDPLDGEVESYRVNLEKLVLGDGPGWRGDREVCPEEWFQQGVYYSSGPEPPKSEVAGWGCADQEWCTSPLSVKTVMVPVSLNGVDCLAIVDDGSQINMVSDVFYDKMTQEVKSPIRTDLRYSVSGVHGEAVPLAGYFQADVKIGALVTRHIFWVNRHAPKDKIFLGMPYIAQNLVDFVWCGYRRVMRVNAPSGVLEIPLHPDDGPVITVAEKRAWKDRRKPLGTRLRALRLLKRSPVTSHRVEAQHTFVQVGEDWAPVQIGAPPSGSRGDWDPEEERLTWVEEADPEVAVHGADVSSPEAIRLEYTWTPKCRTPPSRESREVTPTPKRVRLEPGDSEAADSGQQEETDLEMGTDAGEEPRPDSPGEGDESEALWEESQRSAENIVGGMDPLTAALERAVDFVDKEEEVEDCYELVVEDRSSRSVLLLGPTGRYYSARLAQPLREVHPRVGACEREFVTAYGAYKPVAKKKRPVETTMKEEDKPLMKVPPDLWDELPRVEPEGPDWTHLPRGKRLSPERLEKVVFSMTDF